MPVYKTTCLIAVCALTALLLAPVQPVVAAAPGQEAVLWLELDGFSAAPAVPAPAHNDLLERLRRGFQLPPVSNAAVDAQRNWFVRHPAYLLRVFTRAQRYLPYITEELERRGLPLELALLPIVESAFDPFAYSHGRASGLWQIVPGTGRRFGIRQNWWYDGRRDVVDSTNGALNYLAHLHGLMDGDWLNAIASYNSGEGNVLKAKRRNRAANKPTDFWNLKLPRETESYVPKLIALVQIVRDPAAYQLALPDVIDEPQFVITDIGGQLDLALAAELAGLTVDELYSWNSGFNRWATDPDGPHRLLLPIDAATQFAESLGALPESERVRWKRHKVKNGEALSQIAERYHTTLQAVKKANNISGTMIRAGQYLMIPVASKPLSDYSLSANQRRAAKQSQPRGGQRVEHRVSAGESFWSISRRYGVGMRELASWNGMAPRDTLSVGQKLVVWTNEAPVAVAANSNATTRKLRYTVRRGDSLYRIASRFRISIADLLRWNNLDKNKILRPGQKLTMYVDVTSQSS
ncbi:MAG: LysM peptidoglycan-binding domain-containing protein [Woeseia sp.]|nr:LysM peptidoglycan-binding domain-containing protein [Woeseia sp.]